MTKVVLRFQELLPERDEFELADGTKIGFISRMEIDSNAAGRFQNIYRELKASAKKFERAGEDKKAAARLDAAVNNIVRFILPDIPGEALASLGLVQKQRLIEWWSERNATAAKREAEPPGEAQADRPAAS